MTWFMKICSPIKSLARCAACLAASAGGLTACRAADTPPAAPKARLVQVHPIGDRFVVDVTAPIAAPTPESSQLRIGTNVQSGRLPSSEPIAWQLDEMATAEALPLKLSRPQAEGEGPKIAPPSGPTPPAGDEVPPLPEPLIVSPAPEAEAPAEPAPVGNHPAPEPAPTMRLPQAPVIAPPEEHPVAPPTSTQPQLGKRRIAGPAGPRRLAVLQTPSEALGAVERQADAHIRRGFELGAKGSLFAAREEFLSALSVLVNALDAAGNTTFHATALSTGLTALDEADDFMPSRAAGTPPRSVIDVASRHQTTIFHERDQAAVPPLVAVQRYYTYAQQQLSAAVEAQDVGSRALYGLGKTYTALSRDSQSSIRHGDSKSVVWHQAALMANSENYAAANDLGVLLARWGKLPEARDLLHHSLALRPSAEGWQNLAAVHRALGEVDLAEAAAHEAAAIRARRPVASAGPYQIQWVSPDAFGRAAPAPGMARQARPPAK